MKFLIMLMLCTAPALQALDGVVMNRTTSKPQPGATVTLVRLGSGMNTLGSARTDAEGKYRIDQELVGGTQHLVQVMHEGVSYNRVLPADAPSGGVELEVFDSAESVPEAQVSRHLIAIQPSESQLAVNEVVVYTNSGNRTLSPAEGIAIALPATLTGPVQVTIKAPDGMPIQRPAQKGREPNTYLVKYPIKPGETRIDYNYTMPGGATAQFASRKLHPTPVQIIVPRGVAVESKDAIQLADDPRIPGPIFDVRAEQYALTIKGTGLFASSESEAPRAAAPAEEEGSQLTEGMPRLYSRMTLLTGLCFGMLAIGFIILLRKGSPPSPNRS